MAFTVNQQDLIRILADIKIAEAHAAGTPLTDLVSSPLLPTGLRTVDGTYNNLLPGQETFGSADQVMPRLLDQEFLNDADGDAIDLNGPAPGGVLVQGDYGALGNVVDADPRTISNLIADQTVNNPAAVEAAGPDAVTEPTSGNSLFDPLLIPNVAPDEGITAPVNAWMTMFGQFFDHGLDLINKGGNGTVFIPLQPDDPLYVPGGSSNFMVITRATPNPGPGPDGILGTADDTTREAVNQTTPFVDQNQTYTSHPSHQVFLREYHLVDGKPVATGHLLEGANGGLATWADVKAQARTLLGIDLTDADVTNVPLLATDAYGMFLRGANGYAQIVTANGLVEGNPLAPISTAEAIRTGHAFLDDIAHTAAPVFANGELVPDADTDTGNAVATDPLTGQRLEYDNELLDRHFITGDGRGNENIGLSAVHHVFHSEHNRLVEDYKQTILGSGDLNFLNEWLLTPAASLPANQGEIDALAWNGERLFQAGRWVTEMQYQHLAFEEFARTIQPNVDAFVFSNTADIDPAIFAEFAHVVYRFGHSMLTETVARLDINMQADDIGLIQAFLNPVEFDKDGTLTPDAGAGAIIRGMTRQTSNELDEFITEALRNNLVGLPLDLAAINLARGRDTGVPSLNNARAQFFEMTGDSILRPYTSWVDFTQNIKTPASVINFIAAYGTHASITGATTLEAKRAAATLLVMGGTGEPADRLDFLNSTGSWAGVETGLNLVDFWIGGLAERIMPFGGMLGSTFNFVFEVQMERLQDNDRFYYLSRTQGMNLLTQLEENSFAALVMRNTDLGAPGSSHLPGLIFQTPHYILELDRAREAVGQVDPVHSNPVLQALSPLVVRRDLDGDGDDDYLAYNGADHVVLGGTDEVDVLIGGDGDDTLWGDAGNDRLEGGFGIDHIFGGDGDDIITDMGDVDVLKGEGGNDVIHAGNGVGDLVFGGAGKDFLIGGTDEKEMFGGEGDDFMIGSAGATFMLGNEGDDWLEGGERFDTLAGDNSELFFNSQIIGHDVLNGRGNDTDYDGESGDDIMYQNPGIQRNNGMAGFDWAIHKGDPVAADSDLGIPLFVNQQANILRDRFDLVEGLSGWNHDDRLTGREVVTGAIGLQGAAAQFDANTPFSSFSSALQQSSVDRIAGFDRLVSHLQRVQFSWAGEQITAVVMDPAAVQRDGDGNVTFVAETAADILLGGAGSDTLTGKAGNDIIDGDAWLNPRVLVTMPNPANSFYIDSLSEIQDRMLSGEINPGQLSIVRAIEWADPASGVDTAVYADVRAAYDIIRNHADGSYTVAHTRGTQTEGTDLLRNVEVLQFANRTMQINNRVVLDGTEEADIFTGTPGNDVLRGLGGNDTLIGLGGNDRLDGGTGADAMIGGTGDDTYFVDDPGDIVTELSGEGNDLVISTLSSYTLTDNVERLRLDSAGAADGTGNNLNNIIIGGAGDNVIDGGGGNDTLRGGGGNDRLIGGAGNDLLFGGDGSDTFVFDTPGFGNDRIMDFVDGLDLLDISGLGITAATFNAAVRITDAVTDVRIEVGGGAIRLVGVADATSIDINDFTLA